MSCANFLLLEKCHAKGNMLLVALSHMDKSHRPELEAQPAARGGGFVHVASLGACPDI